MVVGFHRLLDFDAAETSVKQAIRSAISLIDGVLQAQGLSIAPEVKSYLSAQLGADHAVSRAEIEKLALYADGMDEISIAAPTTITELQDGNIHTYEITPEQFELERHAIGALAVSNVEESLNMMQSVLNDEPGSARDIVCLNAGAAVYAAGISDNLGQGIIKADEMIASGAARTKLDQFIAYTNDMLA